MRGKTTENNFLEGRLLKVKINSVEKITQGEKRGGRVTVKVRKTGG